MKKIKKGLFVLVLFLCSINVLAQQPIFTYEVSQSTIDCESNKVCYTISIRADREGDFYFNGGTFRYIIDPAIFNKPVSSDYVMLPKNNGNNIYTYRIDEKEGETGLINIGNQMGFKTNQIYWLKGTMAPESPSVSPRIKIGTTPVEIMKICLTAKEPLSISGENLCYPFVFDSSHIEQNEDVGILRNGGGVQSDYTELANSVGGVKSARDKAEQYLWVPNENWQGGYREGDESIGYTATTGCMTNICFKNCYTDPTTNGVALLTKAGISTLDRNVDGSWVDNSKSGFLKLESKTLGFVPTRMTTTERDALTAEEGMVVWNITNKCLEYYNGTEWVCSQPKCKNDNQ